MIFSGPDKEYLSLVEINQDNKELLEENISSGLSLLWFTSGNNLVYVDDMPLEPAAGQIICLTEFHRFRAQSIGAARLVRFNRPFFCIVTNDSEVGCKGILFFGASELPLINIPAQEMEKFEALWKMFLIEMQSKDELQIEMLQMMLKRLIILCTRLYKEQHQITGFEKGSTDMVREFNYLVEQHFRQKHSVAEYADMLNKSPKTVANTFAQVFHKTPLQLIHERLMLEARRLISYTDKPITEIAYELGYNDVQTFSRFFKNQEGLSPLEYKQKQLRG